MNERIIECIEEKQKLENTIRLLGELDKRTDKVKEDEKKEELDNIKKVLTEKGKAKRKELVNNYKILKKAVRIRAEEEIEELDKELSEKPERYKKEIIGKYDILKKAVKIRKIQEIEKLDEELSKELEKVAEGIHQEQNKQINMIEKSFNYRNDRRKKTNIRRLLTMEMEIHKLEKGIKELEKEETENNNKESSPKEEKIEEKSKETLKESWKRRNIDGKETLEEIRYAITSETVQYILKHTDIDIEKIKELGFTLCYEKLTRNKLPIFLSEKDTEETLLEEMYNYDADCSETETISGYCLYNKEGKKVLEITSMESIIKYFKYISSPLNRYQTY